MATVNHNPNPDFNSNLTLIQSLTLSVGLTLTPQIRSVTPQIRSVVGKSCHVTFSEEKNTPSIVHYVILPRAGLNLWGPCKISHLRPIDDRYVLHKIVYLKFSSDFYETCTKRIVVLSAIPSSRFYLYTTPDDVQSTYFRVQVTAR